MQQHITANKIKDKLTSKGFRFTMSLYGVIDNPETQHPEYRRIEVFINGFPDQEDVGAIKNFFNDIIPYPYYTIWAYNRDEKEIIFAEGWL